MLVERARTENSRLSTAPETSTEDGTAERPIKYQKLALRRDVSLPADGILLPEGVAKLYGGSAYTQRKRVAIARAEVANHLRQQHADLFL